MLVEMLRDHPVLRAAERLFADHGFRGVSLRTISVAADAPLALIHYHFGSKLDLYRAVWEDRYSPVASARMGPMALIDYSKPREQVLRDIVDLFFLPNKVMNDPAGKCFLRLFARAVLDGAETEHGIIKEFVEPRARVIMDVLRRVLPELSDADFAWGYQFMSGVWVMLVADVDRASRLSDGAAQSGDLVAAHAPALDFIVGGWLALIARAQADPSLQQADAAVGGQSSTSEVQGR